MTWKNFVSPVKLVPRRRMAASAIMYGLSLAVRFTSATGEEVEIPAQSIHNASSVMSIFDRDGGQLPYADWRPNAIEPIFFRHRRPPPMASMPGCPSP
ncbi:hypothetical protein ABIB94_000045 [Bradyrhizobium sp. JR7.2]|uniref:Uncharacterized protein n=1 Tax=Bradyrhizobium barranii TaxID=2992140 RepID=A0ABY3QXV7_9BRAD|nr:MULTISPECIES: hypothetical protein [Bradyrhizobium]UFW89896.1 hypothetical protein BjapCC829_15760 [Bradyrhizobium japonicum]WFT98656.1 hypothetical protein QA633_17295 [Bradyrhizobium barranii]